MKDLKEKIYIESGQLVEATAPMIISASRATDIPAFYTDWFFNRLKCGYCAWRNPWNGVKSYVSFSQMRFVVFWSKNPEPLLERLDQLPVPCYIQYTLNDYEAEGLEPGVPLLRRRIDTFRRLVDKLGLGGVVWRFDPLTLTDKIGIDELLEKVNRLARELSGYTERLVFSFADIASYKKVARNLQIAGVNYHEWTEDNMLRFARGLQLLNLPMQLTTCAERIDLSSYGITHGRCIDPDIIAQRAPDDMTLQAYLWGATKDRGQRPACGCIPSKDIGAYNTCPHGCAYCYANTSPGSAASAHSHHNPNAESIN
ncbi:MAG: DUF1848 domain-containing protein [Bacteroidales bacterium]|nr:DUF1848 domain-containing protein [Bacteroidales bacterium]